MWSKKYVTDHQIIEAIEKSQTMSQACAEVKLKYGTFKRRAQALSLWKPNQHRVGMVKLKSNKLGQTKYKTEDILDGKYPEFSGTRLRKRLIDDGTKENKCEDCGINEWNGKPITCELHHIDGDHTNHRLRNLKILCPNCHSQTDSFSRVRKLNASVV